MEEKKETFTYTYSAAQQEEIAAIRKKYAAEPIEVDKMEQLRKLDAGVTQKAMIAALTVGVLGALIMGTGMSLIMTDLAAILGMASALFPGIAIGIVGMAGVIAAYPLYQFVLKKERAKVAPQILKLTEELSTYTTSY